MDLFRDIRTLIVEIFMWILEVIQRRGRWFLTTNCSCYSIYSLSGSNEEIIISASAISLREEVNKKGWKIRCNFPESYFGQEWGLGGSGRWSTKVKSQSETEIWYPTLFVSVLATIQYFIMCYWCYGVMMLRYYNVMVL